MPITFACDCGKQLRVADEYAGKRAKCPECGEVATVPSARRDDEDEEPPRKAAPARRVAERDDEDDDRPRQRSRRDEDDEEDRPRRRRRDEEEDDRPPRRKRLTDDGSAKGRKRKSSEVERKARSLEGKVANGGVLGGIAAMVIAVVWFVVGLVFFDWIAFYPPVLFVIGLVGFIKGLVSSGSEE